MDLAHCTPVVHEIMRRPVTVVERPPRGEVIVLCDGIINALFVDGRSHVCGFVLEGVLRGMHTHHLQAAILVAVEELGYVLVGPLAVNAGIGPEIHQRDGLLPLNLRRTSRVHRGFRIYPTLQASEGRHGAAIAELIRGGRTAGFQLSIRAVFTGASHAVGLLQCILRAIGSVEFFLHTRRPIRKRPLQRCRSVERYRHRQHNHQCTRAVGDALAVSTYEIRPRADSLARQRKKEQRRAGTDGKTDRQNHVAPTDLPRRTSHGLRRLSALTASTIGSTGRIQGESPVTSPPINPMNAISHAMSPVLLLVLCDATTCVAGVVLKRVM